MKANRKKVERRRESDKAQKMPKRERIKEFFKNFP